MTTSTMESTPLYNTLSLQSAFDIEAAEQFSAGTV